MQEAEPKRESDVDHRRCFCVSSPSAHLPTQPLIPFWFPSRFPICVTPPLRLIHPPAEATEFRGRRSHTRTTVHTYMARVIISLGPGERELGGRQRGLSSSPCGKRRMRRRRGVSDAFVTKGKAKEEEEEREGQTSSACRQMHSRLTPPPSSSLSFFPAEGGGSLPCT